MSSDLINLVPSLFFVRSMAASRSSKVVFIVCKTLLDLYYHPVYFCTHTQLSLLKKTHPMLTHWLLTLELFVNHDANHEKILTKKQIHTAAIRVQLFSLIFLACSLFSYFFSFSNEKRLPQKERATIYQKRRQRRIERYRASFYSTGTRHTHTLDSSSKRKENMVQAKTDSFLAQN